MGYEEDIYEQGEEGEALGEDIFRVLTAVTHRIDGDIDVVVEVE
jgi:hypothetical protein